MTSPMGPRPLHNDPFAVEKLLLSAKTLLSPKTLEGTKKSDVIHTMAGKKQLLSNIKEQILVKFARIMNLIATGKWVNNASVLKDMNKECKDITNKISSNVKTLENAAREAISKDISDMESVLTKVEKSGGDVKAIATVRDALNHIKDSIKVKPTQGQDSTYEATRAAAQAKAHRPTPAAQAKTPSPTPAAQAKTHLPTPKDKPRDDVETFPFTELDVEGIATGPSQRPQGVHKAEREAIIAADIAAEKETVEAVRIAMNEAILLGEKHGVKEGLTPVNVEAFENIKGWIANDVMTPDDAATNVFDMLNLINEGLVAKGFAKYIDPKDHDQGVVINNDPKLNVFKERYEEALARYHQLGPVKAWVAQREEQREAAKLHALGQKTAATVTRSGDAVLRGTAEIEKRLKAETGVKPLDTSRLTLSAAAGKLRSNIQKFVTLCQDSLGLSNDVDSDVKKDVAKMKKEEVVTHFRDILGIIRNELGNKGVLGESTEPTTADYLKINEKIEQLESELDALGKI